MTTLDHLVAVDRCGCIVGAIVDDPTFTGQVWLKKFYRENVGMEIRRVKAADFHGLDVCPHLGTPDPQKRLFA